MDSENLILTSEEYKKFLKSDFWIKLSAEKRNLVGKCERCGRGKKLYCHHVFYRPNWYDTKLEDLEVLCFYHHQTEHGIPMKKKFSVTKKQNNMDYTNNNEPIQVFYTLTERNTVHTNSRSKRYTSIADAEKECQNRINLGSEGFYIMKTIKYVSPKPTEIPINVISME